MLPISAENRASFSSSYIPPKSLQERLPRSLMCVYCTCSVFDCQFCTAPAAGSGTDCYNCYKIVKPVAKGFFLAIVAYPVAVEHGYRVARTLLRGIRGRFVRFVSRSETEESSIACAVRESSAPRCARASLRVPCTHASLHVPYSLLRMLPYVFHAIHTFVFPVPSSIP